ncbi:MAG: biotin--[acetyl-CoA-carboxylase] ligase [Candidatus Eisenbacteria bacterium]|nr:biotin--[acetyl-CoA-carboxylase] ligase [Candidatus Eisenbacteria bacterium]
MSEKERIDESVLALFDGGEYRTAGELARAAGIGPGEVNESLRRLEEAGYVWERHPVRGIALRERPDHLVHSEVAPYLSTRSLGRSIRFFRSVESTNDSLLSPLFSGAEPGTVLVSEEQTRGRGRLDRRWETPPFRALLFSVLLGAEGGPTAAGRLTLVSGVAAAEAVRAAGGPSLAIRWPNDLVAERRKVCGILCEYKPESARLVLGVGMNVNQTVEELPAGAASLRTLSGRTFRRGPLLAAILNRLEVWVDRAEAEGFETVRAEAERQSALVGRSVTLERGEGRVEGIAVGIGRGGGLLVRTEEGTREYRSGEVIRVRPVGEE